MRFTTKDLRAPRDTLADVCENVKITRADIIFLNTLISIANKSHNIPECQHDNLQIAQLLAAEELRPGTMTLIRKSPYFFDKHVAEYSKKMAKIQEDYYKKHPEKRPSVPAQPEPATDNQVVDAESTQQIEQTNVDPEEV